MLQLGGFGAAGKRFCHPLQPLSVCLTPGIREGRVSPVLSSYGGCKKAAETCRLSPGKLLGKRQASLKNLAVSASLKPTPDVQGRGLRAPSERRSGREEKFSPPSPPPSNSPCCQGTNSPRGLSRPGAAGAGAGVGWGDTRHRQPRPSPPSPGAAPPTAPGPPARRGTGSSLRFTRNLLSLQAHTSTHDPAQKKKTLRRSFPWGA